MIRILILSLLISAATFAQETKPKTTLQKSVEQVKTSAKELGNLFKSKEQKEKEKLNAQSLQPAADSVKPVVDSIFPAAITNQMVSFIVAENKPENPKITKTQGENYLELLLDYGQGMRTSYHFSTTKKDHAFGDLNNDGKEDLVLKLYSNTGGNSDYLDLCVYIQTTTGWKLFNIHSSSDEALKDCKIGQFIPQTIENGLLIGESQCYTETDPRCCPSLKYKTTLKWINNELRFVSKEKQSDN